MSEACANCRFYLPVKGNQQFLGLWQSENSQDSLMWMVGDKMALYEGQGFCRRHAPVVVNYPETLQFPIMADAQWCGDYEAAQ